MIEEKQINEGKQYYIKINNKELTLTEYLLFLIRQDYLDECKDKSFFKCLFIHRLDLVSFGKGFVCGMEHVIDILYNKIELIEKIK